MTNEEKRALDAADVVALTPPGAHGTTGDGQGGDEPIPNNTQDVPSDDD